MVTSFVPERPDASARPARPPARRELAFALLRQPDEPAPAALRAAGFGDLSEVAQFVADSLNLPRMNLDGVELAADLAKLLPRSMAERKRLVPVFAMESEVTLATSDPARPELFDWISRELKRSVITVVSTRPEIDRAIKRLYDLLEVVSEPDEEAEEEALSAEAVQEATAMVDRMITRAVELKASDIHLEAAELETLLRYRVDGMLRVVDRFPVALHPALVSRIKVMAQLDISERQAPQDGRIKLRRANRGDIDLRVSVLPTYYGEKVCCRILDNTRAALSLDELGFEPDQLVIFERMIRAPYGMLLVTGPTGSGKSTTLYGALNAVRSPELNVVSVEDPVEYQLPGINQVQVNPKRGLTFAGALRSILRQDPNVVLVGEIRDRETGVIAAEAALTGHLVMSSLHTNDAPSAITRLTEMGIEPYLVAPSLVGVIAQRLVRKVCAACAEAYAPTASELESLGLAGLPESIPFRRGRGCDGCQGTGYSGRTAVREFLEVTDALKTKIGRGVSAEELRAEAVAQGFKGMRFQALRRLLAGETTTHEVLRATR
jgi:type IV pilus assembly protein PilB